MDISQLLPLAITIVCSIIASGGFWAWLQKRTDYKDVKTRMLLGLAHDRLVYLCLIYIDRGGITKEEFENIDKYLYEPYKELGGNGTVTKLMDEVKKLPITSSIFYKKGDDNEKK